MKIKNIERGVDDEAQLERRFNFVFLSSQYIYFETILLDANFLFVFPFLL